LARHWRPCRQFTRRRPPRRQPPVASSPPAASPLGTGTGGLTGCRLYRLPDVLVAGPPATGHLRQAGIGEWSTYHEDFRLQKLPYGGHCALGDCRATLRVIRWMAADLQPIG
ncbi:MAG: hypothetical protein PVF45_13775, partial [Anaerolineae bacterium]